MKIVKVRPKEIFAPLAVEVTPDADIDLLCELVKNTYPREGFVRRRGPSEIGEGIIDVVYGSDSRFDRESIHPYESGWLMLGDERAIFYPKSTIWNEYEEVN